MWLCELFVCWCCEFLSRFLIHWFGRLCFGASSCSVVFDLDYFFYLLILQSSFFNTWDHFSVCRDRKISSEVNE